jgi:hypothetical protein
MLRVLLPLTIAFVAMLATLDARSGALVDANNASAKADDAYFHGLVQLGPNPSQSDLDALAKRTIVPARQALSDAIGNFSNETESSVRKGMVDVAVGAFGKGVVPSWVNDPGKMNELAGKKFATPASPLPGPPIGAINAKGSGGGGSGGGGGSAGASQTTSAPEPEATVNGSFDKELTFGGGGGKKKSKASPKPAPNPAPTSNDVE